MFKIRIGGNIMSFFHSAIGVLQTLVIALGAGLAVRAQSTFWKVTATTIREQMHRAHKEVPAEEI